MTRAFHTPYPEVTLPELIGTDGVFIDGDWVESKDQDKDGDVRLLQLADIGVGEYLNKSDRFMTSAKAKALKCTYVMPGDILIARMPDPVGRACIFTGDEKPCVTVVDVCILRPDTKVVDPNWLVHRINSPGFQKNISSWITGSTRQRISRGNLSKLKLPLPPIPEQKRIAAILDKADVIRRKRQQAVKLTEELLRSVFLDMFGDPVTNSKGWKEARLEDVAEIVSGVTKGRKLDGKQTIMAPYLRVANVQDGYLDLNEIKEIEVLPSDVAKYRLKVGDVLLTEGGDPDKLGRGSVWHGQVTDCIHQNHIFRVRSKTDKLMPDFLSMLIGSERGKRYFLRAAKQTTGIASINSTQLKNFPVLLPSPALQQHFAQTVTNSQKLQQRLSDAADTADTLFTSLLQRAFRGELS